MNGICTLANDVVYDQLVALLNSIEKILGSEIPVCIYPFDEKLDRIAAEIAKRPNVFIYDDRETMAKWDKFMLQASPASVKRDEYRIYGGHRRFCAFDGPFDKFVYMDADTLLMNSLDHIFQKLDEYDCVVYDFQFKSPRQVYNIKSPKVLEVFEQSLIDSQIFCSGFYGSKKGIFSQAQLDWLAEQLQAGEVEILFPTGDQPVLNYMFMKSGIPIYNFAYHLPANQATGNAMKSRHFEEQEHILYDRGNRLTYLHYIGMLPELMSRACAGENLVFPYRDLFLYYRFLHEPEKYPVFQDSPQEIFINKSPSLMQRILRRIGLKQ